MKRHLAGLFAISEILVILILGGSVLGGLTAQYGLAALGVDISALDETAILRNPTYMGVAVTAITIGSRFFWLLLLGFLILHFVHGVTPRYAGVSRGGHSIPKLIGAGLLLFAFASLPWKLLLLANEYWNFGTGIEEWALFSNRAFTAEYMLLMLASLVLLPPLFEEPFARGYMRVRLAKAYGAVGGVILAGVMFMLAHGHFYQADAVVIGSFAALIFSAICWAWSAYRLGSVIPAIIAHALTNFPAPIEAGVLLPMVAIMGAIVVFGFVPLVREIQIFISEFAAAPKLALLSGVAVIAAVFTAIIFAGEVALIIGLASLMLMIVGWLPPMRQWGETN